jgi:hypothetical protein
MGSITLGVGKEEITNWPGSVSVLKRTVCQPSGQVGTGNVGIICGHYCIGGFLRPLREWMRGFNNRLRRRPSPCSYC